MLSVSAQLEMPKILNAFKKVTGPFASLMQVKRPAIFFVPAEHKGEEIEVNGTQAHRGLVSKAWFGGRLAVCLSAC